MAGGGEGMNVEKIVITLNHKEVLRLTEILLDEEKEEALAFLNEVLKPQVDQATRSQ
jgi:hypothetical protein